MSFTVTLPVAVLSRANAPWMPGEASAFLAVLRHALRAHPGDCLHFLTAAAIRATVLQAFGRSCILLRLAPAMAARVLGRLRLMHSNNAVLRWMEDGGKISDGPCGRTTLAFKVARAYTRKQLLRIAQQACELPPYFHSKGHSSPPDSTRLADTASPSAPAWPHTDLLFVPLNAVDCALFAPPPALQHLAAVPYGAAYAWWASGMLVTPVPAGASAINNNGGTESGALLLLAEAAGRSATMACDPPHAAIRPSTTTSGAGHPLSSADRHAVPVAPRRSLRTCGTALVQLAQPGEYRLTRRFGVAFLAEDTPSGLRCFYLNDDDPAEPVLSGELVAGTEFCVSVCTLSMHGRSLRDSHLVAHECAPRELREFASTWTLARDRLRLEQGLRRDLLEGGPLCSPPLPHGLARHPLHDGVPPPGMALLSMERVTPTRDFMEVVHLCGGFNCGPRRSMPDRVLSSLQNWRLAGLRRGCATYPSVLERVQGYIRRAGMTVATGEEYLIKLTPEDSINMASYRITPCLVRRDHRHLILLGCPRGGGPQYLGVMGAAALMGITPSTAKALHSWLLRLANGKVAPDGSPACLPAATGVIRAVSMLGAAMQQCMVRRILRYANSLLLPSATRTRSSAEQFAGLAVATTAAQQVWTNLRPLYFSDTDPLARACLAACYPHAKICCSAEAPTDTCFLPRGLFLLIAGFPCNLHSQLARDPDWDAQAESAELLCAALVPLTWGTEAPALVLLENTVGILSGVFPRVCALLVLRFQDYHWMVGTACPSEHADMPTRRKRVYWLAVRRDISLPVSSWPQMGLDARAGALRPLPLRSGMIRA